MDDETIRAGWTGGGCVCFIVLEFRFRRFQEEVVLQHINHLGKKQCNLAKSKARLMSLSMRNWRWKIHNVYSLIKLVLKEVVLLMLTSGPMNSTLCAGGPVS